MRAGRSIHGLFLFAASLFATACGGPLATAPRASEPAVPAATAPASLDSARLGAPSASPSTGGCDDAEDHVDAPADDGASAEGGESEPTLDDGLEPPADASGTQAPSPFAELTDAAIESKLRADIGALGPISIGGPRAGVLIAGMQMPEGANWEVVHPSLAWGTKETVDGLTHAFDAVAARFPNTPKAFVGDISAKHGGHLPPHISHQSGRDVDVGYYLNDGYRWYATATAANLDKARTWFLIRTLLTDSDVDLVLVDINVQRILKAYALEIGEDPAWLDAIFQAGGKSRRPLIFHAKGHATHLHVRFYSPTAQELGRRAYRLLVAKRLVSLPTAFITHTAKQGETLSHLALRYKVTIEAIKKANALRKDTLRVGKAYKIPHAGGIAVPMRLTMMPRAVPPAPVSNALAKSGAAARADRPCLRASAR